MDHAKPNVKNSESPGVSWIKKPEKMIGCTENASNKSNPKKKNEKGTKTIPLETPELGEHSKKDNKQETDKATASTSKGITKETKQITKETKQITKETKQITKETKQPRNVKSKNQSNNLDLLESVIKKFKNDDKTFLSILEKLLEFSNKTDREVNKKINLLDLLINNLSKADKEVFEVLKKQTEGAILSSALVKYFVDPSQITDLSQALLWDYPMYSLRFGRLTQGESQKKVIVKTGFSYHTMYKEATLFSQLDHPNVIKMLALDKRIENLAMEFMDEILSVAIIEKKIDLSSKNIIKLLVGVAAGMEYLHSKNILLCTLTCMGVLVNKKNESKLFNFNHWCYVGETNGEYNAPKNLIVTNAPSPETLICNKYTFKTDVWSMGVTCWEAFKLISTPQFGRLDSLVKMLHLKDIFSKLDQLDFPPICPPALQNYIRNQMLHADPDKRPTFSEMKTVLSNI